MSKLVKKNKLEKYSEEIRRNLDNCLTVINSESSTIYSGKVRECYELDEKFALVTTDRQSAFDRVLASVPFKGQVLNMISAWWFEKTGHIMKNHLIEVPDPNISVVEKCAPFPVEFVVRGYITGSSNTSLWTNYAAGKRNYCGINFPDGLVKNQKLENIVITPTTKAEIGDVPISPEEIISQNLMNESQWEYCSRKAIELFSFGQKVSQEKGYILVDTKYEMGISSTDEIVLIDEVHSPDSSRFWEFSTYEERFAKGEEPENIDKEFLRLWFKKNCDPYNDKELPQAPSELIVELSLRYIQVYEKMTGSSFDFPHSNREVGLRVSNALEILLM